MEPLTKILTASIELFRQYGFKTVTMDDIARRAGISKKTLYQHFANKHEIVNESVVWYKTMMTDSCMSLISNSENALEEMVRMLGFMDQMYKQINPMAIYEMQRFFPEAYNTFRELLVEKDVSMMRENIRKGIAEGLYRPEVNDDLMARYKLETSLIILQPNLMVNERYNLLAVGLEIGEHFLYGIMTQKGIELYCKYKEKYIKQPNKI